MASVSLAKRLTARGHRLSFVSTPDSETARALQDSGVALVPLKRRGYLDPAGVLKVRAWLEGQSVDVLHCHYAKDLWVLVPALCGRYAGVPLVLTKHIGTLKPKKDALHRMLYRRVDFVIAISEVIRRNVVRTHPIAENKVGVIPNGVDLSGFNSATKNRREIRRSFGIPENATVVGMAGRLSWWKGYREFIQTAEFLVRNRHDVWFLAVGGATLGEEAEAETVLRFARSLDVKDRLVFTGFRNDMADLYSAMDLFVYPAYAEAFGLVLIEAMAAGLPVVSTDCDGVPEIVQNGVTGMLVPARDAQSLIRAVDDLLAHPRRMRAFGQAGKKRTERVYDFETVVSRIERLYERLMADRKNA